MNLFFEIDFDKGIIMIQHCYAMMADLPDHRRHTVLSFYDVLVWFLFYSAYYKVKIKIVKKQE